VLYRLKSTWQNFDNNLSALARELAARATSWEEERARLDHMNKDLADNAPIGETADTPQPVWQSVQNVVDSVERTRQVTESGRVQF
jgi:hypothetical protein